MRVQSPTQFKITQRGTYSTRKSKNYYSIHSDTRDRNDEFIYRDGDVTGVRYHPSFYRRRKPTEVSPEKKKVRLKKSASSPSKKYNAQFVKKNNFNDREIPVYKEPPIEVVAEPFLGSFVDLTDCESTVSNKFHRHLKWFLERDPELMYSTRETDDFNWARFYYTGSQMTDYKPFDIFTGYLAWVHRAPDLVAINDDPEVLKDIVERSKLQTPWKGCIPVLVGFLPIRIDRWPILIYCSRRCISKYFMLYSDIDERGHNFATDLYNYVMNRVLTVPAKFRIFDKDSWAAYLAGFEQV